MSADHIAFTKFADINDGNIDKLDAEELFAEVATYAPDNKTLFIIKSLIKDLDINMWMMKKDDATEAQVKAILRKSVIGIRKLELFAKYLPDSTIEEYNKAVKSLMAKEFSGKKKFSKVQCPKCLKKVEETKPKKEN